MILFFILLLVIIILFCMCIKLDDLLPLPIILVVVGIPLVILIPPVVYKDQHKADIEFKETEHARIYSFDTVAGSAGSFH